MTTHDSRSSIAAWLATEVPDRAPDSLLEGARHQISITQQRRSWWPARRDTRMNLSAKLAIGAAAALAVAFVGLRLLPAPGPGDLGPSPLVSPTQAPTEAPGSPRLLRTNGDIDPGDHVVEAFTETPFRLTMPDGWTLNLGMIAKGDFYNTRTAVLLRPWIVTHVYGDACQWQGAMRPVGPTKAELVGALSAQTGRDVEGPTEVELGGLPATRFVFTVPSEFDASGCDDGYLRPWPDTGGNEDIGPPMFTGSITTVYVVETGGKATAIQAARYEGSSAADVAELQSIVDSIDFVP